MSYISCKSTRPLKKELRRPARSSILGIHACSPEVMEAHIQLYRTISFGEGPLSRAMREMIAVAVSGINGCHY